MQFVEQISIAPNIVVNLPSSSSNEKNNHFKDGISNAADIIDVNDDDDQSEVEVVSAAKSLIESQQNSTNSLSLLTTSTSIVQPSTSEMSSAGMIDENEAILLLARYGLVNAFL